ncbi:MAG: ROK family protein [Gaiellaceae bacterium]
MSPQERVLGVDLGGTKILAGLVGRDGAVERDREWPTPLESQAALVAGLELAVEELLDEDVAALGFGIPSRVDQRSGHAYGSVNTPLDDLDFRGHMEARFGLPVGFDNDANAATLAEWTCGAGRGARTLIMLTLGTGVGGGFILDERLYRGWAEAGHTVVVHDGKPCPGECTGRGHLEAYCTGVAAGEAAEEAFGGGTDAQRLVELADEGEQRSVEILGEIGRKLGSGIGSLVNLFAAERVVIGGGFGTAAFEHLAGPALEVARREALAPADEGLELVKAELGEAAGLIGAGLLAFEALP